TSVEEVLLGSVLKKGVDAFFDPAHFAMKSRFRLASSRSAPAEPPPAETPFGVHFLMTAGGCVPPTEIRAFIPDQPLRGALGIGPMAPRNPADDKRRLQELLLRVPLPISVVLGRVPLHVEQIGSLEPGDVVTLEKRRGSPVELCVAQKAIAHGS